MSIHLFPPNFHLKQRRWWQVGFGALGVALLSLGFLFSAPFLRQATAQTPTTWYVRPNGGSPEQCTGQVNAPYPGTGLAQPCAWDHPFRALPPTQTPRMKGGDTLFIASGSYRLGYGAPETTTGACYTAGAWDCFMPPIPSGPDPSHPTRILGAGWNTSCNAPPQLWGTQRAALVFNLRGTSNVEVACLEITDHAGCIEHHANSAIRCQREVYPFGDWASVGLWAEDATNVTLRQLNIHGFASAGIVAGRLHNWLVEDVRIAANGWVGWDGDLPGQANDSNSGDLHFKRWVVEWNGCAESWPEKQTNNCWAQSAGGYGDGVGTGTTGGRWLIEDSLIRYNTSDGLDLLYVNSGAIEVRRSHFHGNAGNQLKTKGPTSVENSIIVGNCNFFTGKAFTYQVDFCRAAGAALSVTLRNTETATIVNSTLASQGDCIVTADNGGSANANARMIMRNNIYQGYPAATSGNPPTQESCLAYESSPIGGGIDIDYSVINNVRHNLCPGSVASCNGGAGLWDLTIDNFDAHLVANSPAINLGNSNFAPTHDIEGRQRDIQPDIGAYEWNDATLPATATPTATATPIPPTHTPTPSPTPTTTPSPLGNCVISLNNGALYTARRAVTVYANTTAASQIQLSNDGGFVGATWRAYRPATNWTLPDVGNRITTLLVYARLRNSAGSLCNGVALVDSIIFDPLPPNVSVSAPVNGLLTVTAFDQVEGSGIADMQIVSAPMVDEALWQPFYSEIDVRSIEARVVYLYVRDGAGNVSAAAVIELAHRQFFLPLITN